MRMIPAPLLLTILIVLHSAGAEAQQSSLEVYSWVSQNYQGVLDYLLPSATDKREDMDRIISVRILPPGHKASELEFQFTLRQGHDGTIDLSVSYPKRVSIFKQLEELKSRYPTAGVKEITGFLSIEHRKFTEQDFPQLTKLLAKFGKANSVLALADEWYTDPTTYQICFKRGMNSVELVLIGPGGGDRVQPHPLIDWAEEVRTTITKLTPTTKN